MKREDICRSFEARIDDLLADPADGSHDRELAELRLHGESCASCIEVWATASESDRTLALWIAPEPPANLTDRILDRVLSETRPDGVHCLQFTEELPALLEGDALPERAERLHQHAEHCAPCDHRIEVAKAVDSILKTWGAPEPPVHLTERIVNLAGAEDLDANSADEPTQVLRAVPPPKAAPSRVREPMLSGYRAAIAYAAAAAILIAVGMSISGGLSKDGGSPPSDGTGMMTVAKEQIEQERELRLQQVRYEQFPASIGEFNTAPVVLDRVQRSTGNRFHGALRRAAVKAKGIDNGWLTADHP